MAAIVVILLFLGIGGFAWRVMTRAKNATQNLVGATRRVTTRMADAIGCKACGAEVATVQKISCACGFTKTRNIASACPNCGSKSGFLDCPSCGESIRFG